VYPPKYMMWCTVLSPGTNGVSFLRDFVNGDNYFHILKYFLFLKGLGVSKGKLFFSRMGLDHHMVFIVHFQDRILSLHVLNITGLGQHTVQISTHLTS
jgi:hypothetical protein